MMQLGARSLGAMGVTCESGTRAGLERQMTVVVHLWMHPSNDGWMCGSCDGGRGRVEVGERQGSATDAPSGASGPGVTLVVRGIRIFSKRNRIKGRPIKGMEMDTRRLES